jgi:hypothetical protein
VYERGSVDSGHQNPMCRSVFGTHTCRYVLLAPVEVLSFCRVVLCGEIER